MLAQDAINVLGKREQPIQNLVLFDGEEYQAPMYSLHPIFNDGLDAMVTGDPNAMSVDGSLTSGMDMSAMSATDPLLAAGTGSSTNGASFP
jgi:hypothetical protein